jgi:hypothetical protein
MLPDPEDIHTTAVRKLHLFQQIPHALGPNLRGRATRTYNRLHEAVDANLHVHSMIVVDDPTHSTVCPAMFQ